MIEVFGNRVLVELDQTFDEIKQEAFVPLAAKADKFADELVAALVAAGSPGVVNDRNEIVERTQGLIQTTVSDTAGCGGVLVGVGGSSRGGLARGVVRAVGELVPDGSEELVGISGDSNEARMANMMSAAMSQITGRLDKLSAPARIGDRVLFNAFAAQPVPASENLVIIESTYIVGRERN
jgi:co-chaperonin GroES (HSP10)